MKGFFSTLRAHLMLLTVLVLLPMCALIAALGTHYYRFVVTSAYQNAASLVRLLATEQEQHIEDARDLLATLASMPNVNARRGDYCGVLVNVLRQRFAEYAGWGMTDANGKLVCNDPLRPLSPDLVIDRAWFQKTLQAREFSVGAYQIDPGTGKTIVMVVLPIMDEAGQLKGALYAAIDLAWITRLNALAVLPEKSILLMFDHEGMVLRRNPDPQDWEGKRRQDAPFIKEIIARGKSGVLEMPALDGIRRLVAFETLASQRGQIYLVVGIPSEIAFAQLSKEFFAIGSGIALAVIATLLIAWVVGERLIAEKIRRLAAVARRFGEGDLDVRNRWPHASNEIGALARTFDAMADAIKQRESQVTQYNIALDQHAIVSIADALGNITFTNEKFCEISGYTRDELIGKNHRMLNSGLHPAEFFDDMWRVISSGKVWRGVIRNRNKTGGHYWVISTIVPQLDEYGLPRCYLSVRTDVTDSFRMQESLQRSEERYRLLAENTQDVVGLHDCDGYIIYMSPSVKHLHGYDASELVGQKSGELVAIEDHDSFFDVLLQLVSRDQSHRSAQCRMRCKSGETIWAEVTATPIFDVYGKLTHIQSTSRDITQRKKTEDSLRLLDKAITASSSGIVLFSIERGNPIIYVNPAFAAITGYGEEDAIGQDMRYQVRHVTDEAGIAKMRVVIRERRNGQVLLQFTRKDGVLRWADCSLAPVRDSEGDVTHFVAAFSDTSERMSMIEELKRAKEISERASFAKSEFLSRMTHELRTPLNAILGFAQLLEIQGEQLTQMQLDRIKKIIKSGWHLRKLVDEVLDLARIEAGNTDIHLVEVSIGFILGECMEFVEHMASERQIRIVAGVVPHGADSVRADPMRLKQVLLNLLSNAIKFNRDEGVVTIERNITANGDVRISISDTGPGIAGSRQGELFMPFSRLDADKAEIPGTGIGLALSRRYMQLMGGRIGVESVAGIGSTFWIELARLESTNLLV